MAGEWTQTMIGNQVTLQRGFDITREKQFTGLVPVVSSGGIGSFNNEPMAKAPGVVLGRKGTLGSVYFLDVDYWPHDTTLWVKDFHGNSPRFVYYFFRNMSSRLLSMDVGAANPTLNRNHIHPIEVQWPPSEEQRAIAHILGTLDDKIELNRKMNATLEEMARALFKSWFVDFDPVRAKSERRNPGLPKPLADLFPASFVDSELGEIPKGWKAGTLGDYTQTYLGGTPSRVEPEFWNGDIPWINSGKANEFRIIEPSEYISKKGLDSSATKLLPLRTTVLAITGATLGQVSLTEIATCANQSIVGVVGTDVLSNEYIYCLVKEHIDVLVNRQTGGAQQHINKNDVNAMTVLLPSQKVVVAFTRDIKSVFDRIAESCFESRTLASLRDTLLPKLISGELRVKDAEKIVGRVG